MCAVCPDGMCATEKEFFLAVRAAQVYCDCWQIKTSFRTMKQELALEKVRVRTFRRLANIFSFCILTYVFVTDFLREAKGFRKLQEHLVDNLKAVSMRAHALLAGICALVDETKIRCVSGRPCKLRREYPQQKQLRSEWLGRAKRRAKR